MYRQLKDIIINGKTLAEILEAHKHWICEDCEGWETMSANLSCADLCGAILRDADLSCATLRGADLSCADLRGADLSCATLRGANIRGADLRRANLSCAELCGAILHGANLSCANLSGAILHGADIRGANLHGADLSDADLCGANLCGADLRGARLENVRYDEHTTFYALQCPEEGAYIGWKKACGYIVKLRITEDSKRSSATTRKCRASKAEVLEIQSLDGSEATIKFVRSDHDSGFVYKVGKIVEVADFDENRWSECSAGIHHFITRQEAVNY